ncbi:MAG: GNAT family N-acetyltransferase [Rubrivivax sp.]
MTARAALTLETPRLRLRPFEHADWHDYAGICADAEVMRYIGDGTAQTTDQAWQSMAAFLGHWALLGYGMWALQHREGGPLLGRVGYLDRPGWPGFELGWVLGREHWGHGYAREAAAAALKHAFEVLQRPRVISLIRPANLRSIAVATALGETLHSRTDLRGGEVLVYEAVC